MVQNDERLAQGCDDAIAVLDLILYQLICSAPFRDVSENQDHASDFSAGIANWRSAIVNWYFRSVVGDEQCVVS
jgi:hypothetical protein